MGGPILPQCLRDYAALVGGTRVWTLPHCAPTTRSTRRAPLCAPALDMGCLHLNFGLDSCVPNLHEDFQSSCKVLAFVGICHLPSSPDLARVAANFIDATRSYPYHSNQKTELDLDDYEAEFAFHCDLAKRSQVVSFLKDTGFVIPPVMFYH